MYRLRGPLGLIGLTSLLVLAAQAGPDAPPSAQSIMEAATKKAKTAHKPIFLRFDASW